MTGYLFLAATVACEVTGTTMMKLSAGFTKPLFALLAGACYLGTLLCMTMALKELRLSLVYAVWSGLGLVLVTAIGALVFKEDFGWQKALFVGLIVAGVVGLNALRTAAESVGLDGVFARDGVRLGAAGPCYNRRMRLPRLYRAFIDRYVPAGGGDTAEYWLERAFYSITAPAAAACLVAVAVCAALLFAMGEGLVAALYVAILPAAAAFAFWRRPGVRAKALAIAAAFHAYGVLTLLISGPAGGSGILFAAGALFCALFAGRAAAVACIAAGFAIGAGFGVYWDSLPGGGMLGPLSLALWLVLCFVVVLMEAVFVVAVSVLLRGVRERFGALTAAEAKLRAADAERESLVRELIHRSKNNLQVVSSLISLHSAGVRDAVAQGAFRDIQSRILAMALVQRKLFEARDLARIDLSSVLRELAEALKAEYADPSRVRLALALAPVSAPIEVAVPLALAASEMLTNALKHAFPPPAAGTVEVALASVGEGARELTIADDGAGFAAGFDPERDGGVGLRSVFALARDQIGGSIEWRSGRGVRYVLRFGGE